MASQETLTVRRPIGLILACLTLTSGEWAASAAETTTVPLAAAANMGFADQTAGDGVGGWSDQGAANSFAEFDLARRDFGGVPFSIVDPASNHGKAVLSFRHTSLPSGLHTATIDLPAGSTGRWLYLLHTTCYGAARGTVVGSLTVTARDGSSHPVEVRAGQDVADWWNPTYLPNGRVVVAKQNQSATVGVYLSRFDLGADLDVAQLTLTSSEAALWIVVGATLSTREVALPGGEALSITAGNEWKALAPGANPAAPLTVAAGSVLDCSAVLANPHCATPPFGTAGRLIARPDGRVAWAGAPERAVRFFGCSLAPGLELTNPADAEPLAEAIQRQGYNLVRLHFLDFAISGMRKWGEQATPDELREFDRRAAAGEAIFDPRMTEVMDRYVAALRARGIAIYLDAMSSWTGYYPVNPWTDGAGGVPNLKAGLYGDAAARQHYRDTVRALLTHTNPYTGTTFASDPQVIALVGFNEQETRSWQIQPELRTPWQAFLAGRYASVAEWRSAWGGADPAPGAERFDQVPVYAVNDLYAPARARDVGDFLNAREEETAAWMEHEVRADGFAGLFTHYDYLHGLRFYLPRAKQGVVTMHGYHGHPSNYIVAGSKVSQNSSLSDALNWWRGVTCARIAGKPLAVTEYGHVYWNRYRYEEGLAVGAYGAFQDLSVLVAHATPVLLRNGDLRSFRVATDPIARASQVVSGLLFLTQAVTPATHRVDVVLPRATILSHSEQAIPGDLSRLALVTGFAAAVEGTVPAIAADLRLPFSQGASAAANNAVSTITDRTGGEFGANLAKVRGAAILPAGNRSDAAAQIYESDTGELLLDAKRKQLTVVTPTIAGLCLDQLEQPLQAGALTVERASVAAGITVASRDDQPLAQSKRLLLVIATDARNGGEQYEDPAGEVLKKLGTGPALLRTGSFTISLQRAADAAPLHVWVVALDGTRQLELPVERTPQGLRLTLDTAAWACGPSPFLELVAP
jgi:hypothetical protein